MRREKFLHEIVLYEGILRVERPSKNRSSRRKNENDVERIRRRHVESHLLHTALTRKHNNVAMYFLPRCPLWVKMEDAHIRSLSSQLTTLLLH